MNFENLEYLGRGILWELYSSIFAFFVFLLSLIFIYKKFFFGSMFFLLSVVCLIYLYISWKNRIHKCSVFIDSNNNDFVVNLGNKNIVFAMTNFVSFYLDGNSESDQSYIKINLVSGEFYFFRGNLQNSDILKLYHNLQLLSHSEHLQISENLGPIQITAKIVIAVFFIFLTLFPIYLIISAFLEI
ncbi:hypothetical protein [Leptospira terpstrae]|uniref:Uncharacterized protein n=1 Tax=Leptospira terpstrae serovar Hualin str. LT 11-33 = ATCC 700639 TaxID=1257025 RepID=N1VZT3_9LEPT|nr:hypothetical protein [Leptospira terpstrae]EMY62262.1 hypothetical protein LEP1GSC203_2178 [Leptospira terpstrae serovar Hualin str. LT 11-33 = ATCC 700639]